MEVSEKCVRHRMSIDSGPFMKGSEMALNCPNTFTLSEPLALPLL